MPTARRKNKQKLASISVPFAASALEANAILRHTRGAEVAAILGGAELVEMPARHVIYNSGETINDVFFPLDCVLSVVTQMEGGEAIEVGTVGREGMSGIPLLMGGTTTANDCYCQVPGRSIKIPVAHFRHMQETDAEFRALLNRYLQAYVNFLGQLTGCNLACTASTSGARAGCCSPTIASARTTSHSRTSISL